MRVEGALNTLQSIRLVRAFKADALRTLVTVGNRYSVFSLRLGTKNILVPAEEEFLHALMLQDQKSLVKTPGAQHHAMKAIGSGLVTTDQDEWKKKRTQAKGLFSSSYLDSMMDGIARTIGRVVNENNDDDLYALCSHIASHVIGSLFFGAMSEHDIRQITGTINQLIPLTYRKIVSPFPFVTDPFNATTNRSRKMLLTIFSTNISQARRSHDDNLIRSHFPQGDCAADIANIFCAGFETTAVTLTWLLYEIGRNERVRNVLKTELDQSAQFNSYSELVEQMPYAVACVKETLRLYPPIWIMSRTAINDFVASNTVVRKGTEVVVSPFLFQNIDAYWDTPAAFRPERHITASGKGDVSKAYFPFGIGVRSCIGEKLALMEIYLCMRYLLKDHTIAISGDKVKPQPHFTLRQSKKINYSLKQ